MPSPVGHALGGLIVALAVGPSRRPGAIPEGREGHQRHEGQHHYVRLLLGAAVIACLPDVDFLWGRHNLETHSVGFVSIVGLAAWAWTRSARWAIVAALAVGTHILFDWLGSDTTPPLGVLALWPFSREFYFADAFVFEAISRRYWLPNFVQHNVLAVLREILLLLPIAAGLAWWRRELRG